jgi:flagellar biogenesis protein FliO
MIRGFQRKRGAEAPVGGLMGRLVSYLRRGESSRSRLVLLERVTLAPRQTLALVEAEGRRLLVATSPDGAPTFYSLDSDRQMIHAPRTARPERRISW